jgi:hypothetical protein
MNTEFWLGDPQERDHMEHPDEDEKIILKQILK